MNVLVTGGGGFIGSALAKELLKRGYGITSFSRKDYPELRRIGIEVKRGDIADPDSVLRACKGIDIVFHVAAKAGMWGSFQDYFNTNVRGTENIINACRKNNIRWLVYTSSASVVFGGTEIRGGDESMAYPRSPVSYYTRTKALAEQSVLRADSPSLKTIALRPHIVIGPGDKHLIPRLLDRARKGRLIQVGDGSNLVDLSYIDNVIKAHICAVRAIMNKPDASGKAFFISNGEPVLLWNVINEILKGAGMAPVSRSLSKKNAYFLSVLSESLYRALKIRKEPVLTRFLVQELSMSHWFRIDSARRFLDYNPDVTNQESIYRLIASLQNH
jgi:nucleoside-diphosphate-sugar epimerase